MHIAVLAHVHTVFLPHVAMYKTCSAMRALCSLPL
jgi:hypothetical protein